MDLPHVQVNQLANHRFQPQHLPIPRNEQFGRDPLTTSLDLQLTIKRPLSQIHSSEDQMAQVPIESWCQASMEVATAPTFTRLLAKHSRTMLSQIVDSALAGFLQIHCAFSLRIFIVFCVVL